MMRYGGYGMMGGFGGLLMLLFMLALATLVVLGILALLRYLKTGRQEELYTGTTALEVLSDRYARGEINDEEYAIKKAALAKK